MEVIKPRQQDWSIFFTKFIVGFINFLWTFIRMGRNQVKFWISISYETTVLAFILVGYLVMKYTQFCICYSRLFEVNSQRSSSFRQTFLLYLLFSDGRAP